MPKEVAILVLAADGLTTAEIARRLHTTHGTIKGYLGRMYAILGLWNRVELALYYVRWQERFGVIGQEVLATALSGSK